MKFDLEAFLKTPVDDWKSGRMVIDGIVWGMAPFHLKNVNVEVVYDVDYNKYRIIADVVLFSGYRMAHVIPIYRDDLIYDKRQRTLLELTNEFMQAFRNREDWPVPANIELGTN